MCPRHRSGSKSSYKVQSGKTTFLSCPLTKLLIKKKLKKTMNKRFKNCLLKPKLSIFNGPDQYTVTWCYHFFFCFLVVFFPLFFLKISNLTKAFNTFPMYRDHHTSVVAAHRIWICMIQVTIVGMLKHCCHPIPGKVMGAHLESVHPPWFPHLLTNSIQNFLPLSIDRVEISDKRGTTMRQQCPRVLCH